MDTKITGLGLVLAQCGLSKVDFQKQRMDPKRSEPRHSNTVKVNIDIKNMMINKFPFNVLLSIRLGLK